jgi:hypothetical protein
MVNTGRPSGGCILCRKRRIKVCRLQRILKKAFLILLKCDEGRPGCLRCPRIGKYCPGYPDKTERPFRNYTASPTHQPLPAIITWDNFESASTSSESGDSGESTTTEQQQYEALGSSESSLSPSPRNNQPSSQGLTKSTSITDALILTSTLQNDVAYQSTCLYFATYVYNPRLSHNRDDFYFLPKMFATANPDSCLHQAVKLIGLAVYANRWNPAGFEKQIRARYAHVIQATNAALQDPVEYLQDETLMAVWLLGAFEVYTSTSVCLFLVLF